MRFSQQELNERWLKLKQEQQPPSDYAEALIRLNSDLVQEFEIHEPGTVLWYTRSRDYLSSEWGNWGEGFTASV